VRLFAIRKCDPHLDDVQRQRGFDGGPGPTCSFVRHLPVVLLETAVDLPRELQVFVEVPRQRGLAGQPSRRQADQSIQVFK
jgi:hypothetical protein